MSTRKEERERLRQQRLAAQKAASSSERRRLMIGYVVAGIIVLAIGGGVVAAVAGGDDASVTSGGQQISEDDLRAAGIKTMSGVINDYALDTREGTPPPPVQEARLEQAAKKANCELQLDLKDEGNRHFGENATPPDYGTDPANSGDHINPDLVQADGAYSEPVEPKYYVHTLEHGRIVIQYAPDLPEEQQLELKGLFDESPEGMMISPNDTMEPQVAAAAWTQLLLCDSYEGAATIDAIRAFRDTFRGRGPEDVPIVLPE
jgi:hypothetical protein